MQLFYLLPITTNALKCKSHLVDNIDTVMILKNCANRILIKIKLFLIRQCPEYISRM